MMKVEVPSDEAAGQHRRAYAILKAAAAGTDGEIDEEVCALWISDLTVSNQYTRRRRRMASYDTPCNGR